MSNTNTGGPAFPVKQYNRNIMAFEEFCGLTVRDYFAAKAMQGLVGCFTWRESVDEITEDDTEATHYTAIMAYEMADAMLKARGQ